MLNSIPKIKTISCFLIATLLTGFISCSENSVEPEPIDPIEGTYLVQGFQVNKRLCYIGSTCENGEVLSSDTLYRSFEISIEKVGFRKDTLLFRGLEGADVNILFNEFGGSTSYPNCYSTRDDCAYSKLTGNQLFFEIRSPSRWYDGTGNLSNGTIKLETRYFYRGKEVDFFLTGCKINNKF